MEHCICKCDTQFWHFVLVTYHRPVNHELARNFLVDPSRRQVQLATSAVYRKFSQQNVMNETYTCACKHSYFTVHVTESLTLRP